MSFAQSSSSPSRSIAAFFDTKPAAEKAVADLAAAGVSRSHVSMVEGTSASGATSTTSHEGFLQSLRDMIMPDEDRHGYAEGLRRGGYLVSIKTEDANHDRVLDILDRDGAVDMDQRETAWRGEGWTGYQATAGGLAATGLASPATTVRTPPAAALAATGKDDIIPIYEESLDVSKREVSHGRLRVRSYVVETPVDEKVSLRTESVQVDRRPVDRAISATDAMFQDRTIELEEFAEEAVVSKQARVVEEISLRKEAHDRVETIHDTVRRTEVDIDDGRKKGVGMAGSGTSLGVKEGSDAGRIVEHMDVIASDGTKVGTVDHMEGSDKIKLAKSTSPDGQHHHVPMSWVDHVDQHVHLKRTAAEVKASW